MRTVPNLNKQQKPQTLFGDPNLTRILAGETLVGVVGGLILEPPVATKGGRGWDILLHVCVPQHTATHPYPLSWLQ